MDIQLYETREAAELAIRAMAGWDVVEAVQINRDDMDTAWAIIVNGTMYLRTDGYVR